MIERGSCKPVNSLSSPLKMYLLAAFVALLSGVAGYSLWQLTELRQQAEPAALIVLPEPRGVPAFTLTDHDGQAFGNERLLDRWSLLFFGFTHCPDVCPSTLYDLHQLNKQLSEALGGHPAGHQVVFVSVDPERDTPAQLRDYVTYFDPAFVAVTGEHDQLQPLTRKLGIAYRIEEHAEGETQYNVDHSASILLLNPQGLLHGVFPAPHDVAAMTADLRIVMDIR